MSGTTKVKRTYSLEPKTVMLIERLAHETRRDFSAIVDLAVQHFAKSQEAQKTSRGIGLAEAETIDLRVEAAAA